MFTGLFNNTCEIQRKTETQDSLGSITENWSTISTNQCRLDTAPKAYKITDNIYKTTSRLFTLFLDTGVDITRLDRVKVDGKVYDVQDVQTFDAMLDAHHIEVMLTISDNN